MKIAAVVVTYNRKEYLLNNISHLLNQENNNLDIIIIDNASTDGTKDAIEEFIINNQVIYVNTGMNLGGAGGFNYGIKFAYELNYDYIWIMDDDTYPYADALNELLIADSNINDQYGFLASVVLWKDGSLCKMNLPKFKHFNKNNNPKFKQIIQTSFVSMFIPRNTIKNYGLPIKEFFIWGDDVEYSRRIGLNTPSYLILDSKVFHATKSNVGSNIVYDDERLDRYKYAYRNEVYIAKHESLKRIIYQIFKVIYHILKIIVYSKSKKLEKIKLILEASYEGIKFNPKKEYIEDK